MGVPERLHAGGPRLLFSAAATVQVVWFYLAHVPTAFSLEQYEAGLAPMPFQQRLALAPVLRWAHHSLTLTRAADWLGQQHAWFPGGVRPEALVELPIDVAAVVITGCIAERMYAHSSRHRLLQGFVYPLTLAMVAVVYDLYTIHNLRFVYDMPSMAIFAAGLYLLYTCQSLWIFALLFVCGTVNRETTLLLLPALLLQRWSRRRALLALALVACWLAWHVWVTQQFAGNPSAAGPRLLLNLGTVLCPFAWPQFGTFVALCVVPLLYCRGHALDPVLRRWRLLLPLWACFMFHFGLLVETRVFGELIGYLAPMVALALEQVLLMRWGDQRVMTRAAEARMVS